MKKKLCFILGNKGYSQKMRQKLKEEIGHLLDEGYREFFIAFENLFGKTAISILQKFQMAYKDIKIFRNINDFSIISYIEEGHEFFLPQLYGAYFDYVFYNFNLCMAEFCDVVLCHIKLNEVSHVFKIYQTLLKLEKTIISL